jgi:hypothetical protein
MWDPMERQMFNFRVEYGVSKRSCQITGKCAEGAADRDGKLRQWLESPQTGQIDRFGTAAGTDTVGEPESRGQSSSSV